MHYVSYFLITAPIVLAAIWLAGYAMQPVEPIAMLNSDSAATLLVHEAQPPRPVTPQTKVHVAGGKASVSN